MAHSPTDICHNPSANFPYSWFKTDLWRSGSNRRHLWLHGVRQVPRSVPSHRLHHARLDQDGAVHVGRGWTVQGIGGGLVRMDQVLTGGSLMGSPRWTPIATNAKYKIFKYQIGGREVKTFALVSRRSWVRIPPESHVKFFSQTLRKHVYAVLYTRRCKGNFFNLTKRQNIDRCLTFYFILNLMWFVQRPRRVILILMETTLYTS